MFGRGRRWFRPPRRLRPTRAGWIFFALTFGVGFAALNTGNNLLYLVLALMLAFLVLSGVLSEAALRSISVRRRLPPELGAERDGWIALEIRNEQPRLAAYAVAVEDRVVSERRERAAGRCFCLRLEPGGRETRSYRIRPTQRGRLDFAGFVVSTRFPFGLFSKSLLIEAPERAWVVPALDPVHGAAPRAEGAESGRAGAAPRGNGSAVSGLRAFAHGDALRRIDWATSLRDRDLWVREVETEQEGEVWVRLSTRGPEVGEAFEREVRRTASQAAAWLDRGLRVGLATELERFEPEAGTGQRARLLDFLARVVPAGAAGT